MWNLPVGARRGADFEGVLDAMCASFAVPTAARARFEALLVSPRAEHADVAELADRRVYEYAVRRDPAGTGSGRA